MDLDAVKDLLEAHERAFKTAMDLVIEQRKRRIQATEGTVSDLIKGLEFSEAVIADLQNEVRRLRLKTRLELAN